MNTNNIIASLTIFFASLMTMQGSWSWDEAEKPNNLMTLIESGKIDELVDALGVLAELEATDALGRNVVHYAAQYIKEPASLIAVLSILLDNKIALAKTPDSEGKYPAELAASPKNKELIERLIATYDGAVYNDLGHHFKYYLGVGPSALSAIALCICCCMCMR